MRPIDADVLKDALNTDVQTVMFSWNTDLLQLLMIEIDEAPTIDVEPVRHGRWIPHAEHATCSVCFDDCWADSVMEYNRCPNCGAKMDTKEDAEYVADHLIANGVTVLPKEDYFVLQNRETGMFFRGKGANRWGKYYNQATIYRLKKVAENSIKEVARHGEKAELVKIKILEMAEPPKED